MNSLHSKLSNYIDNKHKQIPNDQESRKADSISLISLKDPEERKSIFRKLNSFQRLDSNKNLNLDKIESKVFFRTLKTLNFEIQNDSNPKVIEKVHNNLV